MATVNAVETRSISHVPRRSIVAGSLGAALLLITLGLMFTRPTVQGPPGPQGIPGLQGLPGPPGPPDARIQTIVSAMARIAWLEQRYGEFKEARDKYISETQSHVDVLKNINTPTSSKPLQSESDEYVLTQKMSQMAKDDFGQSINLGEISRFGTTDLSRLVADFNKAKIGIDQIDDLYKSAIKNLRSQILDLGKSTLSAPK